MSQKNKCALGGRDPAGALFGQCSGLSGDMENWPPDDMKK
jgi:hypothetical protein